MRRELRQARRTAGTAVVTTSMLGAFMAYRRITGREHDSALRDAWMMRWSKTLLKLFSVQVSVIGELPAAGASTSGRMVVANHRSAIDIVALLATFGGRMVSRHDIANWPGLGFGAKTVGTVFVDRSSARSGMVAIRAMKELLVAGESITVFPEGTTFAGDEVHPFHQGAFVAVAGSGAPLVPVGIAYQSGAEVAYFNETFGHHLGKISKAKKTRVTIAVGPPIDTKGVRAAALEAKAHASVVALVTEARSHCDRP